MSRSPPLPGGTVTFLFTDLEGSTRLWEQAPEAMRLAVARHNALLRQAIQKHRGAIFKTVGDAVCAVFAHASDAVAAGCAIQRALGAETWPTPTPLRVRMALHTGEADPYDGDYLGPPLNRVARLLAVGHGGQVLLSEAACETVHGALPKGASLRDLGRHRLKDLQQPEHIFQILHPDLPSDFPSLRSLEAFSHNLPAQLTSFIGREQEMEEIKRRVATTRLLTLTGAGGCGKTHLALQVAADLVEEYADGVWLVQLAALTDPDLVPQAVGSDLGIREEPGRPLLTTLTDRLKPRSLLLLLDNCEHLVGACARLVEVLLRSCPNLTVLATSREALAIAGEATWRVRSLTVPDPRTMVDGSWLRVHNRSRPPSTINHQPSTILQFEAVRLFIERAVDVMPEFALTDQNAGSLALICHRLDGMPLAIELAAARVRTLSVEQIAARLDDRFRLLTGGSRTALPRHQTLQATIDWSCDLLSEKERALLRRLSVFAGGWTLEAAEAVCADDGIGCGVLGIGPAAPSPTPNTQYPIPAPEVLDLLTALVEKSLVVKEEQGGEARYRLLETIRQYARDRLLESGEAKETRSRHRDWFVSLAEAAEPRLFGPEQESWLFRLEHEHDNLRTSLEWSRESSVEAGLRLAGALWPFWNTRGYANEGRAWLADLLSRVTAGGTAERAKALIGAGVLATSQGDFPAARTACDESLALCREIGDRRGMAQTLNTLANVAMDEEDYAISRSLYEQSLAIWRELGDRHGMAAALVNLGLTACHQGDFAAAERVSRESLALSRELSDTRGIPYSLYNLGVLAYLQGDFATACSVHEQSLVLSRQVGDKRMTAYTLLELGNVAQGEGNPERSDAHYKESLALFGEIGAKVGIAVALQRLAGVEGAKGQPERAARLLGAVEALLESTGARLDPPERDAYDRSTTAVRAALGEEAFRAAWAEGRALTLEESIAYAIEEGGA